MAAHALCPAEAPVHWRQQCCSKVGDVVLNIIRQIEIKRKAPTWKRTIRRWGERRRKGKGREGNGGREGGRREEIKNRTAISAFSFFLKKKVVSYQKKDRRKRKKRVQCKEKCRKATQEIEKQHKRHSVTCSIDTYVRALQFVVVS